MVRRRPDTIQRATVCNASERRGQDHARVQYMGASDCNLLAHPGNRGFSRHESRLGQRPRSAPEWTTALEWIVPLDALRILKYPQTSGLSSTCKPNTTRFGRVNSAVQFKADMHGTMAVLGDAGYPV